MDGGQNENTTIRNLHMYCNIGAEYNLNATESNINIQELGMFASSNELNSQLEPIKERIYNYDPAFSQQLELMSDENQLIAVRT